MSNHSFGTDIPIASGTKELSVSYDPNDGEITLEFTDTVEDAHGYIDFTREDDAAFDFFIEQLIDLRKQQRG